MSIKAEINLIQKRLLDRLNVKKGSTMFTIIEAISRQAYVKESFVVSQKNSTLAIKCNVTTSTISRNLKKLKDKCNDLLIIEQSRNVEERFASLRFTFISQISSNEVSNGEQTELVKDSNNPLKKAKFTSSLTTNSLVLNNKTNIDLNTSIVNKCVNNSEIIYEIYLEFSQKGISKEVFERVLKEIEATPRIINFKAYLRGALNKVVYHRDFRKGNVEFTYKGELPFYNWLQE